MNNRDSNKIQHSTESEKWLFCPVCGNKIPEIQKLKFCMQCGTNLTFLKENKKIIPRKVVNPYIKPSQYPQAYNTPIFYEPKKISNNEIIDTKNHKLWGTGASIGVPLGAYFLMNFLTAGILAIIIYFSFNLEYVFDFIFNPYFLIFSSFFELIFVLVPVFYVGKYLQNPSLKNRLGLLGFTLKGFDRKRTLKEIIIGLGFAVIGLLLVAIIAFLTEIILEFAFGVEIIRNLSSTTTDIELIISGADILNLILLSLVLILIIGTSEEILFRGFMQKGLMRSLGNKGGIIITAFIFALIHVIGIFLMDVENPLITFISFSLTFIPYFAISLMLGLIYYWRKENLIAVVITHGVYDVITILLAYTVYYGF